MSITFRTDLDALSNQVAPLYCQYDRQLQPQPAFISLGIEDGVVDADNSAEIGNAVPEKVAQGLIRRYSVIPAVKGGALAELLRSEEFTALAERIYLGSVAAWDGNNRVGQLDDDATAAEDEMQSLIDCRINENESAIAPIWSQEYLLAQCTWSDHWPEGKLLAEAVNELEEAAESEGAYIDVDVEDMLLDAANAVFEDDDRRDELSVTHVDALLEKGRISPEEAAEWREEQGHAFAAQPVEPGL